MSTNEATNPQEEPQKDNEQALPSDELNTQGAEATPAQTPETDSPESTSVEPTSQAAQESTSSDDTAAEPTTSEESPTQTPTPESEPESVASTEEDTDETEENPEAVAEAEVEAEQEAVEKAQQKEEEILSVIGQYTETTPNEEGLESDTYAYYYKLLSKADELVKTREWAFVIQEIGLINEKWGEGPSYESETIKRMRHDLQRLEEDFQARRTAHYERLNARKEENLVRKKAILQELKDLITEEKWNAQGTVNKLRNRFEAIRLVDRNELEKLEKQFADLLETFEEKKVEIMVEKAKKEEDNLAGKLYVLDKLNSLNNGLSTETKDWDDIEAQLQIINREWKKIGRIPADKTREVYDQFHNGLDEFYKRRMQFDPSYAKRMERALEKKKALIEEAEMLMEDQDLATAAQRVNILHRNWKKADNLPQKDENELWNRFKEATDKFNAFKQENLDKLRDQENENLVKKEQIIEQAAELKNTEDWNSAADKMQALLDQWKAIGPVPIRKAKSTWDSFKKEMDAFYDARRSHFKGQRKEQKDNLDKKLEILEKLRALKDEADLNAAQDKAKELQNEFKQIGFVPIKQKNKVWRDYREVCDEVYGHFREMRKSAHKINAVVANEAEEGESDELTRKRLKKERIRQEIGKLSEDILKTRESLSYFKTDDDSNPLILDIKRRINEAEEKLSQRKQELSELKKDIDISAKAEAQEAEADNDESSDENQSE